jgi:hypothetical protein
MRSTPTIPEAGTRPESSPRPSALGSPTGNTLRDQILEGLVDADVRGTRITAYGVLYDVIVLVDGLNGATQPVATIWLVAGDHPPRLVSTWVDIP